VKPSGLKIAMFALAPVLPVLIVLFVSAMLFRIEFVARHLDIVAIKPTHSNQYFELQDGLDEARQALSAARLLILRRLALAAAANDESEPNSSAPAPTPKAINPVQTDALKSLDSEFVAATAKVAELAARVDVAAAPVLDTGRPVGLSSRALMRELQTAVERLDGESTTAIAAIEACACDGLEIDALSGARMSLARTAAALKAVLTEWAIAKARQSGAMMKAVNGTVILIIVAIGAWFWAFAYLLPSRLGGARLGGFASLRGAFVVLSTLVFLAILLIPPMWPDLPLVPYRTITLTLFQRTILHGLDPGGAGFMWWSYAAIGLAAAALLAAFAAAAFAAWTYDYDSPPRKSADAVRRMSIVRNSLYAAALVSIASLLALQTDFTAAASLFAIGGEGAAANPTRILIDEIGGAIVQANGIGLGLSLAVAYLPAAAHLHRAYQAATAATAGSGSGTFSLFDSGTFGIALRFLAIVAPALIEPISKLIGTD
jgi:hypothetical protein